MPSIDPAHGPLLAWNPKQAHGIAMAIARRRGFGSHPVPVPSLTNAVFLLPDDGVVVRIAPPGVPRRRVELEVTLCRGLRRLGVPVVAPLSGGAVALVSGAVVSLWEAVRAASAEPDWELAGRATKLLHSVDIRALDRHGLGHVADLAAVERSLSLAGRRGLILPEDSEMLRGHLRRIGSWLERWNALRDPDVLLQGDLVPKNFVFGADGPVLCDTDHLAFGPPSWDLSFMRAGVDAGHVPPATAAAFERGYGAPLPSGDDAGWVTRCHDLRWTVWAVAHRTLSPERESLAQMALGWWRA